MLAKEITSLQHPIVKRFVKLRESRKARYLERKVPIMGIKQIHEAPSCDTLFFVPPLLAHVQAKEYYQVTKEVLKKLTGQAQPEPVAALVPMPKFTNLNHLQRLIALDRVTDPGNVGTLLRTALGLGFDGAFLTDGCADPFNDKALRAAMGATFSLPLDMGDENMLIDLAKNFTPIIADSGGAPLFQWKAVENPLVILGNEAGGVSVIFKNKYPAISIPIQKIESLNVAAAGAIFMYHCLYGR
jgi:RNA methyltransferase, TrmH family